MYNKETKKKIQKPNYCKKNKSSLGCSGNLNKLSNDIFLMYMNIKMKSFFFVFFCFFHLRTVFIPGMAALPGMNIYIIIMPFVVVGAVIKAI